MTLIETIVWVAVFTVAMIALVSSLLYFYRTNTYVLEQSSAVAGAQRGVDEMVRVIREAAYSANGAYPIVSIASNQIVFYSDTDNDGRAERVRYFLSGTSLMRGSIAPTTNMQDPYTGTEVTSSVAQAVHNTDQGVALFQYYTSGGALLSDMSSTTAVRFVSANVVVNVDPNKLPNQLTLRSSAALRNLK